VGGAAICLDGVSAAPADCKTKTMRGAVIVTIRYRRFMTASMCKVQIVANLSRDIIVGTRRKEGGWPTLRLRNDTKERCLVASELPAEIPSGPES